MKNDFSSLELQLLNSSLLELLILQHLFQIKQQITRYKLLQQIQQVIGKESISTAKFYRILAKLETSGLVGFEKGNPDLYYITSKGVNALGTSKTIIGQVGIQVTNFFSESMKSIISFSKYTSGRVLFVDFPKLYDLMVLSLTKEYCDDLSILCDEDTFKWLNGSLENVTQTKYEQKIIKEPDNTFDMIILFYPGLNSDDFILEELYRTLKKDKHLMLFDSINPKEIYHHFVVDILIKQYWPIDYEQKDTLETIEAKLNNVFGQNPLDSLSLNGLELRLYQK